MTDFDANLDFETLSLYFENRKGGPTDTERFEVKIHRSGTVRVEIGRVTYYGFWQQIPSIVRIDVLLKELHDWREGDRRLGSFAYERADDSATTFSPMRATPGLEAFLNSVIEQIDKRFHAQCRDILACYDEKGAAR